jgi:tRNA (guanine-N7-)-methyltransferase
MTLPVRLAVGGVERDWRALGAPLPLDRLVPSPDLPWELEIGFGKGRYLLRRAAESSGVRLLGVEQAQEYWSETTRRARRDRRANLVTLRAEALYALDVLLPAGFARAIHVYFPDPWPKARHERRRLFDADSVDLVLRALAPGATLFFASDALAYGEEVLAILGAQRGLIVERHEAQWPGGPRTNYEMKYAREGRPILRVTARMGLGGGDDAMRRNDSQARDDRAERVARRSLVSGVRALAATLALATLTACITAAGTEIPVGGPPPLPSEETAPQKTLAGSVWVPGYWDWDAKSGTWRWQAGDWVVPPRPDATWVPPSHQRRGNEWVLIRGYWK